MQLVILGLAALLARHLHINEGNETTKIQLQIRQQAAALTEKDFILVLQLVDANIEQRENASLVWH